LLKILHIEDDADTLNAVNLLLSNSGYNTTSVMSGTEALQKISEDYYDLAIIDVMLPDMSGWDIFQTLKKKCPHTKIVFLSVIPISEERRICLEKEQILDYILKPFKNKDFLIRIRAALSV